MTESRINLGASVSARLLNRAKRSGESHQNLLRDFCFERFLYRLGESTVRANFVLKGAMLLRVWSAQPYRTTRDLDLLCRGTGSFDAIHSDIRTICAVAVEPDGITFDSDATRIEAIRAEDESVGSRVTLPARCGSARLSLQIDIGVGDSVWPAPRACVYPALLEFPAPDVIAYPREAVVAEKFDAMIVLGDRNSRIKDFFDLHHLASRFEFDRATLAEAVRRTFERRHTPIPAEDPIGLTAVYWENPSRPAQVRAFARRAGLDAPAKPAEEFTGVLHAFLSPVLEDLRTGAKRDATWRPGGPWG